MSNLHRIPRLYCENRLDIGHAITLGRSQSRYLVNVMRLRVGSKVRLFNSEDGEWLCTLSMAAGKACAVNCGNQIALPGTLPDVDYLFAPLKAARLDYLVQKATEMGARRLRPVITERTVVRKVNDERLIANAREAAEQCNLVCVPEVLPIRRLQDVLAQWDDARRLIHCDEAEAPSSPIETLQSMGPGPLALLVGPEGGFSSGEQAVLRQLPFVVPISLGPRIMRADTAAVAALALLQAILGDWASLEGH